MHEIETNWAWGTAYVASYVVLVSATGLKAKLVTVAQTFYYTCACVKVVSTKTPSVHKL